MNEKIAKTMELLVEKLSALKEDAKEFLSGYTLKQKAAAGAALAAAVIVVTVLAVTVGGEEPTKLAVKNAAPEAVTAGEHDVHAISVDGRRIVYMPTKADAEAVLEGIIAQYTNENSEVISAEFAENVEIVYADNYVTAAMAEVDKKVTETYLCQVYEAIQYITNGTSTPKTYVVKGGDTVWDIAIENNLSPYELAAMNPGFDPDRISIGDVLNLYESTPFLTVKTVEQATEVERIAYDTVYSESAELYKGQTRVTSAGSYGSKEKKVEYVKENGVITAVNVLEETVTQEPVTQYAVVGTTALTIKTGSGTISAPLPTIQLSSTAGQYGASRGGRRHAGADLKAEKGDSIYAADGGTVVFSGWSSSYGYLVKIDHGNGVETRYAHCNTLLVNYGDEVSKGQVIATVGSSGNATGNLLHFEIIINGQTVNPLNYI